MSRNLAPVLVIVGMIAIVVLNALFVVRETQQALVLQFGQPMQVINSTRHEPGLKLKTPFTQNVVKYDKRNLALDIEPREIVCADQERLVVDAVARWRIQDPRAFHTKVSGTRDLYKTGEIEGQLRNTIIGRMTDTFAESQVPFLDMAANQVELGQKIAGQLAPAFAELGLALEAFVVQNLSLPEELQKRLNERIGMNMVGDMGRYTQFQVAQSIPVAAANEGGGAAGAGVGLGAGLSMAQAMMNAMQKPGESAAAAPAGTPSPQPAAQPEQPAGAASAATNKAADAQPQKPAFVPFSGRGNRLV